MISDRTTIILTPILDRDLGQSGARTTNRELVSDVAMSQVGAIFSLEASRLARSNQDRHRLLELCAITGTLVIDEDGCYDPAEFNDGLVLGMKGTFAQAELHIIRARLHGGKINKAHRGEFALLCRLALSSTLHKAEVPPSSQDDTADNRAPRSRSP
jgi:DNA invertase Pin-like site-specific DNA recombinase